MDELVRRQISLAQSSKKSKVAWDFDVPWEQPCYAYSADRQEWVALSLPNKSPAGSTAISRLALYSWNIDFMLPFPDSRMNAALRHLREAHTQKLSAETASVIYLQECTESDLKLLASDPWIQRTFVFTDPNTENWENGYYGTCTLIDRRLIISRCFRVHFSQSNMERDGLFVDVLLGNKSIRLCNTHLESLAFEPAYRPPQMQIAAKHMHDADVYGAVIAGDFNAIQDFDRHLHSDNGLKDAYLELGGKEDEPESGHTWGQQAATVQRERFGTSRMDKVFFCGGVQCLSFERFGAGVEVEDQSERSELVELGFDKPWVTDHLGVLAVFELDDRT